MNVLLLPKYDRMAASNRYRYLQYIPRLESEGIHCVVAPLLDDRYLDEKHRTGRTSLPDAFRGYLRRMAALARARRFDVVMIHCEAFPYLPSFGEAFLRGLGVPYVYDFDDAIFHNYDRHRLGLVRGLYAGKIPAIVSGAAIVTAGNEYLASWSRQFASRVELLPTVVDLARYRRAARPPGSAFTVGWIGSPSTAPYLELVASALSKEGVEGAARTVIVGAGSVPVGGIAADFKAWSEDSEIADIQSFDVGIMPLPDTPWARGKSGFKLIQYMACGIPVVASPVGANRDIVEHGVSGFLAETSEEWVEALRTLRLDPVLRARMGDAGRRRVEERYCLDVTAPLLSRWLHEAAERRVPVSRTKSPR